MASLVVYPKFSTMHQCPVISHSSNNQLNTCTFGHINARLCFWLDVLLRCSSTWGVHNGLQQGVIDLFGLEVFCQIWFFNAILIVIPNFDEFCNIVAHRFARGLTNVIDRFDWYDKLSYAWLKFVFICICWLRFLFPIIYGWYVCHWLDIVWIMDSVSAATFGCLLVEWHVINLIILVWLSYAWFSINFGIFLDRLLKMTISSYLCSVCMSCDVA